MENLTDEHYSPTKKWVLAATLLVVFGYAWLGSRLLEPKLVFPEAVHNAVWIEKLQMRSLRGMSQFGASQFLQWTRVFSQANRLHNELTFLSFDQRVDLLIDVDDRKAYAVSDHRIVLGLDIAASEGQILKAFVKAWLFQKAAPAIQASQLRMEVASDVAVGMIRGQFKLGLPSGETLRLPRIENWLKHVYSFANSCDQVWLPFEIGSFCGSSNRLNPLLLRPLLSAMVMESYRSIPPFQRLNFARQWLATLRDESTLKFRSPPEEITAWKTWVREEAEGFMRPAPMAMNEMIHAAELAERSPLKVDLILRMENWRTHTDLRQDRLVALVKSLNGQRRLEPGGFDLSEDESRQVASSVEVWSNCEVPSVKDIERSEAGPNIVLYLPCVADKKMDFSGLGQGGIPIFARENREVPFVQLNRSALSLALSKKVIDGLTPIDAFLQDDKKALSPMLGLSQAQWVNAMRAYHVVGAIEAVSWYRSAKRPPQALRSIPAEASSTL